MKSKSKTLWFLIYSFFIIIIIFLSYFLYIKNNYIVIEKMYLAAAKTIYEENGIQHNQNTEKIVLTKREINLMLSAPSLKADCNGYVIIYPNNQGPTYKAYIKCANKYQTWGYNPKYLE